MTAHALPLLPVVACTRCGKSCLIRSTLGERMDYPLVVLQPATTARGLCEECAAHWWLFSVDGIRWALEDGDRWVLTLPAVQTALGRILGGMHPALALLDWGRMLKQWDLPWPADWPLPKDG